MVNYYGKSEEMSFDISSEIGIPLDNFIRYLSLHHERPIQKYETQVCVLQRIIGVFLNDPLLKVSLIKNPDKTYDSLIKLVDSIHDTIRIELCKCHERFPASDPDKLKNLKFAVALLTTIFTFRTKLQKQSAPTHPSTVIKESFVDHSKSVYQAIYKNCEDKFNRANEKRGKHFRAAVTSCRTTLDRWHKLISDIFVHINETSKVYAPYFSDECNVVHVSAATLWSLFVVDLKQILTQRSIDLPCPASAYFKLHLKVNYFYDTYVANTPAYKAMVPEHYDWFVPFICQWVGDTDKFVSDQVHDTFCKDKINGFEKKNENNYFSGSVTEIFANLTKRYESLSKLNCLNGKVKLYKVWLRYMKTFAMTIDAYALAYANVVKNEFPNHLDNIRYMCILMNNVRQVKVEVDQMFDRMGGDTLSLEIIDIFKKLHLQLNSFLDDLGIVFTNSLDPLITDSARKLKVLITLTGQYEESNGVIDQSEDKSLEMKKTLEKTLSDCVQYCDKVVLRQLLLKLRSDVIQKLKDENTFEVETDDSDKKIESEIETLYNSTRQSVRELCESVITTNGIDFAELKTSMELMKVVIPLHMIIQKIAAGPPSVTGIVKDCIIFHLKSRYEIIFNTCHNLYNSKIKAIDPSIKTWFIEAEDEENSPVAFLHKLIALVALAMDENRNDDFLDQFSREFDVEETVISTLWLLFIGDLKGALEKKREICNTTDRQIPYIESAYINLHFKVNWLYTNYVKSLPSHEKQVPEYCTWFQPFVNDWLRKIQEQSDKNISQQRLASFLTSEGKNNHDLIMKLIADVFTNYSEYLNILLILNCGDVAIVEKYLEILGNIIHADLLKYQVVLKVEFSKNLKNEKTACTLMNVTNNFLTRSAEFLESIGKDSLLINIIKKVQSCREMLQSNLSDFIYEFTREYLEPRMCESTCEELTAFFLTANSKKYDKSIELFMDIFDDSLLIYFQLCDRQVFRVFFRKLWQYVVNMHKYKVHLSLFTNNLPNQPKRDLVAWHNQQVLVQQLVTIKMEDLHNLADMFFEMLGQNNYSYNE